MKFLDLVENGQRNFWEVEVNIDDRTFKFKVDTGVEVTVISEAMWNSLDSAKPLQIATQTESFNKLKIETSYPRVLALYDPAVKTKVSAVASAYGLGAVLLQLQKNQWHPITCGSRSFTETELRYAQIEKEALALTWALEKFSKYTLGKLVQLETDHKPLIPLLGQKSLDLLPPRVLCFRLRLMRFHYTIHHVPGNSLYTLSRAPI